MKKREKLQSSGNNPWSDRQNEVGASLAGVVNHLMAHRSILAENRHLQDNSTPLSPNAR
jgi:hypothetical protein